MSAPWTPLQNLRIIAPVNFTGSIGSSLAGGVRSIPKIKPAPPVDQSMLELNTIWFILVGVLFATFPMVYAGVFSGFYLPFIALLLLMVLFGLTVYPNMVLSMPKTHMIMLIIGPLIILPTRSASISSCAGRSNSTRTTGIMGHGCLAVLSAPKKKDAFAP